MTEQELKNLLCGSRIHSNSSYGDVYALMRDSGLRIARDFYIASGSSKLCLSVKKLPFVIKWTYNDEGQVNVDEALQEVHIYEEAKKIGLDFFFPKTEIFCETSGITFVKQQKVSDSVDGILGTHTARVIRNIGHNASDRIFHKMDKGFQQAGTDFIRELSELWGKAALVIYGKKKCKALCEFVIKYGINDLHENNLGFMGIKPVILDFSGFHRGFSDDFSDISTNYTSTSGF